MNKPEQTIDYVTREVERAQKFNKNVNYLDAFIIYLNAGLAWDERFVSPHIANMEDYKRSKLVEYLIKETNGLYKIK